MRRTAALALWVLVGCDDESGVRLDEHRAFHETDLAVMNLSLAGGGGPDGPILASWTEVPDEGTDLLWVAPYDDEAVLHRAQLGGFAVEWEISPLVPRANGYARMGLARSRAVELLLDPEGELEGLGSLFGFGQVSREFRLATTASGLLLLQYGESGLEVWSRSSDAWTVAARLPGGTCYASQPFAIARINEPEAVAVLVQHAAARVDSASAPCVAALHLVDGAGEIVASSPVEGSAFDADGAVRMVVGGLVAVPDGGLGSLWLDVDGRVRVYTIDAGFVDGEPAFDLGSPVWTADDAIVASPRLLASETQLFATVRPERDGALGPIEAVAIDPLDGEVSDPFEWPLDEQSCGDAVFVPAGSDSFEYACVGRCQGAGCRTSWLYRGGLRLRP